MASSDRLHVLTRLWIASLVLRQQTSVGDARGR